MKEFVRFEYLHVKSMPCAADVVENAQKLVAKAQLFTTLKQGSVIE